MTFADFLRLAGPPLIGLVLGFVASALRGRGDTTRDQLRKDAELLTLLPENSDAYKSLVTIIDSHARTLEHAQEDARDGAGIAAGLLGMGAFGFLVWLSWRWEHWIGQSLAVVCALIVCLFLVGFLDAAIPKPRVKKSKTAN